MRRLVFAALLAVSLAVLGAVASLTNARASDLPIGFGPGTPPGTMTIGGVTGPLSWSGDNWTMTVAGQTFATGTFNSLTGQTTVTSMPGFASCQAGCTTTVSLTTLTGTLSVRNHGAWVSAVAHWGGAHVAALRGAGMTIGGLVSAAARGSAHPNATDPAAATTHGSGPSNATPSGHAAAGGTARGGSGGVHGGAGTVENANVGPSGSDHAGKLDSGGHDAGRGR
jgi:hypothetical protein